MDGGSYSTLLSAALWNTEDEDHFVDVKKVEIGDDLSSVSNPVFLDLRVANRQVIQPIVCCQPVFSNGIGINNEENGMKQDCLLSPTDRIPIAASRILDPFCITGNESIFGLHQTVQPGASNSGIIQSAHSTKSASQSNSSSQVVGTEQLLGQKALRLDNILPNDNNCWLCSYSVRSANDFRRHLFTVHDIYILHGQCYLVQGYLKEKLFFTCKFCDFSSFQQAQVNRHMSSFHLWNPEDETTETDAAPPTVSKFNISQQVANDVASSAATNCQQTRSRRQLPTRRAKTNISYNQSASSAEEDEDNFDESEEDVRNDDDCGLSDQSDQYLPQSDRYSDQSIRCTVQTRRSSGRKYNRNSGQPNRYSDRPLRQLDRYSDNQPDRLPDDDRLSNSESPPHLLRTSPISGFQPTDEAESITGEEYSCYLCKWSTSREVNLRSHLMRHHMLRLTTDSLYPESASPWLFEFKVSEDLGPTGFQYWIPLTLNAQTQCRLCPFKAQGSQKLRQHLTWSHKLVLREGCNLIVDDPGSDSETSKDFGSMDQNIGARTAKITRSNTTRQLEAITVFTEEYRVLKPFACNLCGQSFIRLYLLLKHCRSSHDENSGPRHMFKCAVCEKPFTTISHMQVHAKSHLKPEAFSCSKCVQQFRQFGALRRHERSAHQEEIFCCCICFEDYGNRGKHQLVSHLLDHDEANRTCKQCGAILANQLTLRQHVNDIHNAIYKTCSICNRSCTRRKFWEHMQKHRKAKQLIPWTYVCAICNKIIRGKKAFRLHLLTHAPAKPYPCRFCERSFPWHANRSKHERRYHGKDSIPGEPSSDLYLSLTNERSPSMSEVETYDDYNVSVTGEYSCYLCPLSTSSDAKLRSHLIRHHNLTLSKDSLYLDPASPWLSEFDKSSVDLGPTGFQYWIPLAVGAHRQCRLCPLRVAKLPALRVHLTEVHKLTLREGCYLIVDEPVSDVHWAGADPGSSSNDVTDHGCPDADINESAAEFRRQKESRKLEPITESNAHYRVANLFACNVCSESFPKLGPLRRHFRKNHKESGHYLYKCAVCEKPYARDCLMQLHANVHIKPEAFGCSKCGEHFRYFGALQQHVRSMHERASYRCCICLENYGSHFQGKYKLSLHLQDHNEVNRICKHCGVMLANQKQLQKHVTNVHHNHEFVACSVCGKSIIKRRYMLHMRSHKSKHKKKEVGCAVCNRRFAAKLGLELHMHTHTGAKPFKCQFCDKSFANVCNRQLHERIHLGIKPYSCRYCGKGFANASNYKQHETTQHKDLAQAQAEDVRQIQAYFGTPTAKNQEKPAQKSKSSMETGSDLASNSGESTTSRRSGLSRSTAPKKSTTIFDDVLFSGAVLEEEAPE